MNVMLVGGRDGVGRILVPWGGWTPKETSEPGFIKHQAGEEIRFGSEQSHRVGEAVA
jgi:hypothetical protein